jgi:hypothetical protein
LQLLNQPFLSAFEGPYGDWTREGRAEARGTSIEAVTDYTFGATLINEPGSAAEEIGKQTIEHQQILVNGDGRTQDLTTQFEHGDIAAHVEFMIPEGSNSGVYFQSRYEIQILDSHGKTNPQHNDMGGIYQRWDPSRGAGSEGFEGVPPRVNAARPAGEWNELDVVFRAPRFDPQGTKIANARFESVRLNGEVIHENIEVTGPTRGGAEGEVAFAPLRLQGDHGPVAYRYITLREVGPSEDPDVNFPGLYETLGILPFHGTLKDTRVLLFSKTAGFRHGSIPDGIACFNQLAKAATVHGHRDRRRRRLQRRQPRQTTTPSSSSTPRAMCWMASSRPRSRRGTATAARSSASTARPTPSTTGRGTAGWSGPASRATPRSSPRG